MRLNSVHCTSEITHLLSLLSSTVLSEDPTSFTITVTSEAGENDESKLDALKQSYEEMSHVLC